MRQKQKTKEEFRIVTLQKCASTPLNVNKGLTVLNVITESRNFTIQKSTRPNFVLLILKMWTNVNMGRFALLLMTSLNCLSHSLIKWKKTRISTCSILKQCGVHSVTKSISVIFAFMPTTGKITDALLINTNTQTHNAVAGKLKKTLELIKTDAKLSIVVDHVMDGKN